MYDNERKELMKLIPKEHHKTVQKLMKISYENGANDMRELVLEIKDAPLNAVTKYGVWHEDCIDGG